MGEQFTRRIEFAPSFDKRDPSPSKNYGIGAVRIWFYLIGPLGAVQWQIGTNWYVPSAQQHLESLPQGLKNDLESGLGGNRYQPQAWDLGYHSPKPMYDGHEPQTHDCDLIGGTCYYDGSGLNAQRLIQPFLDGGSDAVWRELKDFYRSVFESEAADA
jgi:hypothetical protein